MVARIGLGAFEAGFSPGFPLYFGKPLLGSLLHDGPETGGAGLFYTREEIGMRVAWWFAFAQIAVAFSGLIAFGVQHAHTSIANWRLLFIIEGIPTVILGLCAACATLVRLDRQEAGRDETVQRAARSEKREERAAERVIRVVVPLERTWDVCCFCSELEVRSHPVRGWFSGVVELGMIHQNTPRPLSRMRTRRCAYSSLGGWWLIFLITVRRPRLPGSPGFCQPSSGSRLSRSVRMHLACVSWADSPAS